MTERDTYYDDPRIARGYDADIPADWNGDLDFYRGLALQAHAAGEAVLELAAGTGRLAVPIARSGVTVVGLDRSPAMLAVARSKSEGLPNLSWVEADMAGFDLGRTFGLVYIPFRSFLHLLRAEDQLSCLASIHRHLVPGGRLALNFFNPDLRVISEWQNVKRGTLERMPERGRRGESAVRRWASRDYDTAAQTLDELRLEEALSDEGAVISRVYRNMRLRYVFRYEMEYLLRLSGFQVEALHGGFQGEEFGAGSSEMVWTARKPLHGDAAGAAISIEPADGKDSKK